MDVQGTAHSQSPGSGSSLTEGSRLGPYEIVAFLGAGGMGEVYRARDPRLGRDVAVKVLPSAMAANPERLSRFEREARSVSALSHPNILTVFDIALDCGTPYLVSELLEGSTLFAMLASGPISVIKTVNYSIQIARGLDAAHAQGIVHRDIKPGNIFVTRDSRIKILDFGLARTRIGTDDSTRTQLTNAGTVLGTVAYMSPEQIRAQPLDHRSDIFSLGCVMYEMLTGHPPFRGESPVETMNAALKEDPSDISTPHRPIAPVLERVVRRCLEKEPVQRFQSAADLAFALEAVENRSISSEEPKTEVRQQRRRPNRRDVLLAGGGVLAGAAAAAGTWSWFRRARTELPALRPITYSGHDWAPAVSPDGRTLAFTSDRDGKRRIWLKQLSSSAESALTEGPDDGARFSPDGTMLLFIRTDAGGTALYRTPLFAGAHRKLLDGVTDADWSPDGSQIAYIRVRPEGNSFTSVIAVADANGNSPRELARIPNERILGPRWSPDGDTIGVVPEMLASGSSTSVILVSARNGQMRRMPLTETAYGISAVAWAGDTNNVVYCVDESASGFLGSASPVHVVRQDTRSGETDRVFSSPYGARRLDILAPGRLVLEAASPRVSLREYELQGRDFVPRRWLTRGNSYDRQPAFSPDGEWVIFSSNRDGSLDVWQLSTVTGAVRRFSDGQSQDWDPAYTGDGKTVLWSSNRSGVFEIWSGNADGGGTRQITHDGVDAENPTMGRGSDWIYYASENPAHLGLWKIRHGGSEPKQLVSGRIGMPEVSPDGRYVAFAADRISGNKVTLRVANTSDGSPTGFEIVIAIRNPNLQASLGRSRWMPDGHAIAFVGQDDAGANGVFLQEFAPGQDTSSTRRPLGAFDPDAAVESFGISPDGKRMVVSCWEQSFSIVMADKVPGVHPPARGAK